MTHHFQGVLTDFLTDPFPGKWFTVDMLHVPKHFAENLLSVLDVPLNAVTDTHHWRSPMFASSTRRYSYKVSNYEAFKNVLEEQKYISLKQERIFHGSVECQDTILQDTRSAEEILEQAISTYSLQMPATRRTRSKIIINPGEGRRHRDAELLWYPNLYSEEVGYGKLSLRLYLSKSYTD